MTRITRVSRSVCNRQVTMAVTTGNSHKRIRIRIGAVQLEAELKANKTAEEIFKALPVEESVNVWGEEFYSSKFPA